MLLTLRRLFFLPKSFATAIRTSQSFRRRAVFCLLLTSSTTTTTTRSFSYYADNHIMPSSSVIERSADGTITVSPKNEADQSALVVISHGLGDTAEGFADVAEQLSQSMPHVKFILPTAPTQRVTMNMGMSMPSWYDIVGLDERANENCKGIDESQARIANILQTEHERTGLSYKRMVLAGFSQGGALSLFTGLQLPQRLAAIVILSGYLPAASKLLTAAASSSSSLQHETPILHCHGTQDMVVQYAMVEKSKELLTQQLGVTDYALEAYPIAHTVSPEELKRVLTFLQEKLPDDDTCKVRLPDPSEMSVKELKAAIRRAGLTSKAKGFMEKQEFVRLLQDYRAGNL